MRIVKEALVNLFKKPFTRMYPRVKIIPFPRFRGRITFYPKRCISCRLCERYCPVGAIKFKKKRDLEFDLGICITCGMCQDVCPTKPKSIVIVEDFEYSSKTKRLREIRKS